MPRLCEHCGKGSMIINPRKLLRGNLNPVGERHSLPNLQLKKIGDKKTLICTRCIRTLKREKK